MKEILPLYIACILFAYLSHRSSFYDYRLGQYQYKDRIFYTVVIVLAVVFAGLRTNYNDTSAYITGYNNLDISAGWLSRIDWSIGEYPLFSFFNCLMKKAGFSSQSFLMAYSAVTMGISLWFIRKYTNNIPLSVFLFFTMGCFGFSMAAVKQCVATAFCLIGIDRLIQRKRFLFLFWVAVGVLFHPFSAVFLICPLLTFSPWSTPTYLMIAAFAVAGVSMQTWLRNAISMLSIVGVDYDVSNLSGEGVNVFRLLVVWSPVLLSFLAAKYLSISKNRAENLIINLSTLCAEIMFIALFGNPVYFGRVANFFLIFQVISLPIVLNYFEINSNLILKIVIIAGYAGYLTYGNLFSGRSFDVEFSSITLWKYLGELL